MPRLIKHRRGQHQDGGVHQQRAVQGHGGIDQVEAAGGAPFGGRGSDAAGLHQRGMQVEIVRHHGGAQDADGHIEAVVIEARDQAGDHFRGRRFGQQNLDEEADADQRDQAEDESFELADAVVLQDEDEQRIAGGDEDADEQRDVEEQVEADGGAQHLGQVAGGDGDFPEHPERVRHGARIGFAAGLGQIAAGDDAEPRATASAAGWPCNWT